MVGAPNSTMERFSRSYPGLQPEDNRSSSLYSTYSTEKTMSSTSNDSLSTTNSRPKPLTPSYMNASVPKRKPVSLKQPAENLSTKTCPIVPQQSLPRGVLVLVAATSPHSSTTSYLKMMLRRHIYSSILVLGRSDQETHFKQLKIDIYALLGTLGREVNLQMALQDRLDERGISAEVSKAVEGGDMIQGVLCCLSYDGSQPVGSGVLDVDGDQLLAPWLSSVGFVHKVARSTLHHFRPSEEKKTSVSGLFLVTEPTELSPTLALYKSACDTLLGQLASAGPAKNLTVDYADNVLIPELEPAEEHVNGGPQLIANVEPLSSIPDHYPPPESPTKLYNAWLQHEELAAGD